MKKFALIVFLGLLASCNPLDHCDVLYSKDGKTVLECQR